MNNLKTGDSFEEDGYKITRIGAGAEESKSEWALMCIERKDCTSCNAEDDKQTCEDTKVHTWVKKGHCFSVGKKVYKLEDSNREESCLVEGDPGETGIDVS